MKLTLSIITIFNFDSCCQLNLAGLCGTCQVSQNNYCVNIKPSGNCPFATMNYKGRDSLIVNEIDSQLDLDKKASSNI